MKQSRFWLKLVGTALLLHVVLILLSIIEVIIYSYLIAPGMQQAFYDAHAAASAPWVSAVFGSLLLFFIVKRYVRRFTLQQLAFAIGLPAIYLVIDLILISAAGYRLEDYASTFVLAAAPKIAAALLAYSLYKNKNVGHSGSLEAN